jgi:hypothetical protein
MGGKLMRWLIGGLLIALLSIAGGAQAEKIVYVQSAQAPLYSTAQLGKTPIEVIAHGTPMLVTAENSRWFKVTVDEHTGWVVKLMVSDHPPVASQAATDKAMETLMKRARVRPSTYGTTAAARGLRAGGRGLKEADQLDYESVAEMEALQPDAAAVANFISSDIDDE